MINKVNQLNRIKLMLSKAFEAVRASEAQKESPLEQDDIKIS